MLYNVVYNDHLRLRPGVVAPYPGTIHFVDADGVTSSVPVRPTDVGFDVEGIPTGVTELEFRDVYGAAAVVTCVFNDEALACRVAQSGKADHVLGLHALMLSLTCEECGCDGAAKAYEALASDLAPETDDCGC